MTFDPDFYWTANGPFIATASETPEHKETELILRTLFRSLDPQPQSVIDVGCGGGRLARVLLQELPQAQYAGVDLAEAQLELTKAVRGDGDFYLSRLQDFIPDKRWDMALCSEVLLHIPPSDIRVAVRNLGRLAPLLVLVDWTETVNGPIAEWNWLHDYDALFKRSEIVQRFRCDLQTIFVIRTGNA